jgi:hypothetical protein
MPPRYVCFTCEQHCHLQDPEACWQFHEDWRLGRLGRAYDETYDENGVLRRPTTLSGEPIGPAKRPRVKH